ncbi:MAG: site-specific tyrosine recombinase/integron integrase [Candidatus Heimdallarchaeota archaeon]
MKSLDEGINTIDDFLTFLDVERNYSTETIKEYKYDLEMLNRFIPSKSLMGYSTMEIRRFLRHLKQDRSYAAPSLHRKICSARSFFKFLRQHGHISDDPTEIIESPKISRSLPKTLAVDDISRLLEATKNTRDYLIVILLYSTGVRVSELCHLSIGDIDFEQDLIHVVRGKGGKDRKVPLAPHVRDLIRAYAEKLGPPNSNLPLFRNRSDSRLTARSVQRIVRKAKLTAGISKKVTPHALRHAFATHLCDNNVNIRVIQELLGHASLATTQLYTHVSLEHLRKTFNEGHPITTMDV